MKREENLLLSILKGLLLKCFEETRLMAISFKLRLIQLKVTRKWPEDLLSYRFILTKQIYEKGTTFQWKIPYTKEVPFVKNNLYKGKGLDLEVKPLRTKLYWVASQLLPPPSFSLGLSTSCSPTFWQLLVFRATFFVSSNFLHDFWAISLTSFLPILRYLSSF